MLCIVIGIEVFKGDNESPSVHRIQKEPKKYKDTNFNVNLIKTVNSVNNANYLISPYSIEIALNMLKDGADNNTREEIEKVIGTREIKDLRIKKKIGIANALFIKDKHKNNIKEEYKKQLIDKYNSEIIYDSFKTPDKINDWVNNKTNKMINKILDDMSPDFVLGLANAIAIDVEWKKAFDCYLTTNEEFKKQDGSTIETEMMSQSYARGAKYIKNDKGEGIIIPYKSYKSNGEEEYKGDNNLEFIGFMPNSSITDYIENITEDDLKYDSNIEEASYNLHISLRLPRFSYQYDLDSFKEVLMSLGIKEVFNQSKSELTKMYYDNGKIGRLYVDTAIHKTKIELNEKGTKAAAVTFFGVDEAAAEGNEPDYKTISIKFNKPFIYLIRDKNSKELLFFGVVYEPNKWEGSTCKDE